MFILQDTVITIINYDCKIFIVPVIVITIVNYNCKVFMVEATGVDDDNLIFFSFSFASSLSGCTRERRSKTKEVLKNFS